MENEEVEALKTKLTDIQGILWEMYPDMEKEEYNMNTFQELSEALVDQNRMLVEKLQEVRQEACETTETNQMKEEFEMISKLYENEKSNTEVHLKTIEQLSKQLELWKSKSPVEVDKKLSMYESKLKQEAKTLKLDNEHLTDIVNFKDEKIAELQQEIDRLRRVMKLEAPSRKSPNKSGISNLERKIDEVAEKGKIEYKIFIPAEGEPEAIQKERALEKIFTMPVNSLARTLFAQGKIVDEYEQKFEDVKKEEKKRIEENKVVIQEYKKRIDDLTKDRATLEKQINGILEYEKELQYRFYQMSELLEEVVEENEASQEIEGIQKKIGNLKKEWKAAVGYKAEEAKDEISEVPRRPIKNNIIAIKGEETQHVASNDLDTAEAQERAEAIEKHIEDNNVTEAADVLKAANYELPGQAADEVVNKLRIACKVRDKQIEKFTEEIKNYVEDKEKVKECMELNNEEAQELIVDYENVKTKFVAEATEDAKVQDDKLVKLNKRVKELQQEVTGKNKEIRALKRKIKEQPTKDSMTRQENEEDEEVKEPTAKAKTPTNKGMKSEKSAKSIKSEILGKSGESAKQGRKVKEEKQDEEEPANSAKSSKTQKLKEIEDASQESYRVTFVTAENEKNRAIIKELMAKGQGAQNKANQLLYENNVELNNQVKAITDEFETFKGLIEDISAEHSTAINKLSQVLLGMNKERAPEESNEEKGSNISAYDLMMREVQNSKKISLMCTEISFAVAQKEVKVVPEAAKIYKEKAEETKEKANVVYKEYFVEEKVTPSITIEILLERLKRKNESFKELYKLYQTVVAENEELLKVQIRSKVGIAREAQMTSDELNNRSGTEEALNVKQLLTELKEIKQSMTTSKGASKSEYNPKETKEHIYESELNLATSQISELNALLHKKEVELKEKEQIIDEMRMELRKKETDNKQLEYSNARLNEECKKSRQLGLDAKQEYASSINSLRQIERLDEGVAEGKEKEKQYESLRLRQENADLKEQLLNNKKQIDALQSTVNSLQLDRQQKFSPLEKKQNSFSTYASPLTTTDNEMWSSEFGPKATSTQTKLLLQKYENWFDTMQDTLKIMAKVIGEELHDLPAIDFRKSKFSLKEMRDIIVHATETISKLKEAVSKKGDDIISLRAEQLKKRDVLEYEKRSLEQNKNDKDLYIAEMEMKVKQLVSKNTELERDLERASKEKVRLQDQMQRQRLDSSRSFDKDDIMGKEGSSIKMEAIREEGRLKAQKQQRGYRDEEIKKLNELLKTYKAELDRLKMTIKELTINKDELEEYNRKANSEIELLMDTLRSEQEKQKQLNVDLEVLTRELKALKTSRTGYSSY